jgi:hypothetical protein
MVATRTAKPLVTKDLSKAREAASRSRRLKELERIAQRKEQLLRLIAPQQEKCKTAGQELKACGKAKGDGDQCSTAGRELHRCSDRMKALQEEESRLQGERADLLIALGVAADAAQREIDGREEDLQSRALSKAELEESEQARQSLTEELITIRLQAAGASDEAMRAHEEASHALEREKKTRHELQHTKADLDKLQERRAEKKAEKQVRKNEAYRKLSVGERTCTLHDLRSCEDDARSDSSHVSRSLVARAKK